MNITLGGFQKYREVHAYTENSITLHIDERHSDLTIQFFARPNNLDGARQRGAILREFGEALIRMVDDTLAKAEQDAKPKD